MRWLLVGVVGLLALPSPAASAPALQRVKIVHQGRTRIAHVYVPPGHDKKVAVPLVIALHGGGGEGLKFDRSTKGQMRREANARGWLVVYPEGVARGWNDGRKLVTGRDRQRIGVDDVGFLSKLIDHLHVSHGVDPSRVYATGISNGGFMSLRLGIELGAKIAAIAPVTANLQRVHVRAKPTHPMPVLILNGTEDPLVPYRGGHVRVLGQNRGAILSTDATVAWWCKHNGCASTFTHRVLPDKRRLDGTRVHVTRFDGKAPVVLYRIQGGGHTWPGGQQYLPRFMIGRVTRDIDGARVIFDFFARHRRAASPPVAVPKTTTPR